MSGRGFGRSATGGGFGGGSSRSTLSFTTPPPDLSNITQPNLVVSFKGLLKKSDTTQSKALEDIRTFIKAQEQVQIEDAVIKAWSEFYPRISINNSRKVRELAHLVQHDISDSAKAKIQPYIPQMVPTWLAGTFDNDKGVAKAANLGWDSLLNTNEKKAILLKKSQPAILAYVQEGLDETPETLSDERTMSPEDLKATYFRLVGNCIDMVAHLINSLPEVDLKKYSDKYEALFGNPAFLECTSSEDTHLRRSIIQLLGTGVLRQPSFIEANLKVVSRALISEALSSNQLGSAYDLVESIRTLTVKFPEAWAFATKSKKSPLSRLKSFIEKGSQRGPAEYWKSLATLLVILPEDVLPSKTSAVLELLAAIRTGIRNRDEPKSNYPVAWAMYFRIVNDVLSKRFSDPDSQITLIQEAIFPAIKNFILIDPDQSEWSVEPSNLVKDILKFCSSFKPEEVRGRIQVALKKELFDCCSGIGDRFFPNIPVDNSEFKKIQDTIQMRFSRWFLLLEWILSDAELKASLGGLTPKDDSLLVNTEKLLYRCPAAIDGHQGKPYGVASAFLSCMRAGPLFMDEYPEIVAFVINYLEYNLFKSLGTPSGGYLLGTLKALKAFPGQADAFKRIWTATMKKALESKPGDDQCARVALMLLRGDGSEIALDYRILQQFICNRSHDAIMNDDGPSWSVFHAAGASKSISDDIASEIIDVIITTLLDEDDGVIDRGLKALTSLSEKDLSVLVSSDDRKISLLTRLFDLNDKASDTADPARKAAIRSLTNLLSEADHHSDFLSGHPLIDIIQTQLGSIVDNPLSINALVNLAADVFATTDESRKAKTMRNLFPTWVEWDEAFRPFYCQAPSIRLAMSEPFAGALFLIRSAGPPLDDSPFDGDGHSIPLRKSLYTCEVMQSVMLHMPAKQAAECLYFLCLAQQLVSSQYASGTTNFMYNLACHHITTFNSQLHQLLVTVVENSSEWRRANDGKGSAATDESPILSSLMTIMLSQSKHRNPCGYYSGLALNSLLSTIVAVNGPNFECSEAWLKDQNVFTIGLSYPFMSVAILTGFGEELHESELLKWFFNHLIAKAYDINGPLADTKMGSTLPYLVFLNACLNCYDEYEIPTHTVRLAKTVKQILSLIDGQDFSSENLAIASEACRTFTKLLPALKYSTGEQWKLTLENLCLAPWDMYASQGNGRLTTNLPSEDEQFVLCTSSLKMYSRVVKLRDDEDANDDLKDLFEDYQKALNQGLLSILKHPRPGDFPALRTFDKYLTPEVLKIPVHEIDIEEIYPLLGSLAPTTQATAFEILGKALPKLVEDLTLRVVVEKKNAQLPDELLSLLLSDSLTAREMSSPHTDLTDHIQNARRSVLLAWELVLQCLGLAPYKVRIELSKQLAELEELNNLLAFVHRTFDTTEGKMKALHQVQLDKDSLQKYDVWDVNRSTRLLHNVHWLTARVYFLALKFLPILVKNWFLDFTRAGKISMGAWTEKYFTPLVVEDCIEEVRAWRGESDVMELDNSKQMIVKLPAKTGSTITVSYEIDEQSCSISLTFPPRYPLDSIDVTSINRVAVPEKTWTSIIKQISGAVRFSGGNVIDGIEVFRQNVSGFLTGHEPCSICYSIVSENMKLPEKACGGCRQKFHTVCLSKWFASSGHSSCPLCRRAFTTRR